MDTTSKYVKEYDPGRDAPRHEKFNEHLFEVVPKSTVSFAGQQVKEHFAKNVDPESHTAVCQAFEALLEKFPILSRIIVYTYSPAEDLDTRTKMLDLWDQVDEIRNDLRTHRIIYEARFCCSIPAHPDAAISQFPVISEFLENRLPHDFKCTLDNDIRKLCGEEGTIKELRNKWFMTEDRSGNKHTWFNFSPFWKIEFIEKKSGDAEMHVHLLHESTNVEPLFLYADAQIVESFQLTNRFKGNIQVFIYGPDGNLVKPPYSHENPFSFNLDEKYKSLKNSQAKRKQSMLGEDYVYESLSPDISKKSSKEVSTMLAEYFADIAFRQAIQEYNFNYPPAAHLKKYFPWRFTNLLNQNTLSFKKEEESVFTKVFLQGPTNNKENTKPEEWITDEQDLFKNPHKIKMPIDNLSNAQAVSIDFRKTLKEQEDKSSTPSQKIIIRNYIEIFDGKPELSPKEIQERVLEEYGQKISEAGVRQAQSRVKKDLQKLLRTTIKD